LSEKRHAGFTGTYYVSYIIQIRDLMLFGADKLMANREKMIGNL